MNDPAARFEFSTRLVIFAAQILDPCGLIPSWRSRSMVTVVRASRPDSSRAPGTTARATVRTLRTQC